MARDPSGTIMFLKICSCLLAYWAVSQRCCPHVWSVYTNLLTVLKQANWCKIQCRAIRTHINGDRTEVRNSRFVNHVIWFIIAWSLISFSALSTIKRADCEWAGDRSMNEPMTDRWPSCRSQWQKTTRGPISQTPLSIVAQPTTAEKSEL